jgi:hypothetical protein
LAHKPPFITFIRTRISLFAPKLVNMRKNKERVLSNPTKHAEVRREEPATPLPIYKLIPHPPRVRFCP